MGQRGTKPKRQTKTKPIKLRPGESRTITNDTGARLTVRLKHPDGIRIDKPPPVVKK